MSGQIAGQGMERGAYGNTGVCCVCSWIAGLGGWTDSWTRDGGIGRCT